MKKILAISFILIFTITFCSCIKIDNNIENYADDIEKYQAGLFMPNLDDIGKYKEIKYYIRKDKSIFPEYSIKLIVSYDEETYLKEKERLKSAYSYLDAPQKTEWSDDYYTIPIEEFSLAGFIFKIVMFEDTTYPKNFGMVGVSDEKFEIAYLWTYAQDLDYICKTDANELKEMSEFVEYYFSLE